MIIMGALNNGLTSYDMGIALFRMQMKNNDFIYQDKQNQMGE